MLGRLTNEEFIKRFNHEQKHGSGHGMTCGGKIHQKGSPNLVAVQREGKVVLVCPMETCDYVQTFFPKERPQSKNWGEDR
ncbi:MAG: hypothetical protein Q7R79_03490 [bacterium]|nr:hypothetical protein [bacterium]